MNVNDKTIQALAASLNFRELRQKILSANIANAETPGYKAKRVDFEDALRRALDLDGHNSINTESKRHYDLGGGGFGNLKPDVYQDPNGVVSEDGNTVNRDHEMAIQAENRLLYEAAVQLLNKKLGLKKYIVTSER